jgi:hypothetical protein
MEKSNILLIIAAIIILTIMVIGIVYLIIQAVQRYG